MSDKFSVNPGDVRGLGNVVLPKSSGDYWVDCATIEGSSEVIDGLSHSVFGLAYKPGAHFEYLTSNFIEYDESLVSFTFDVKLVYYTGASINSAPVKCTVNDVTVLSVSTDGTGVASFTIPVTGSRYLLKLEYAGNSNVAGCTSYYSVFVGGITGLDLISIPDECTVNETAYPIATLTGTDIDGLSVGIPGQEVMVLEEYTPTLRLRSGKQLIEPDEPIGITVQLTDGTDGSMVCLPGQSMTLYEEYTPELLLKPSKSVILPDEAITISARFADNVDGNFVCLPGETVEIYEEYSPDIRVEGPTYTSRGASPVQIDVELYDSSDGSRVCLAGEEVEVYDNYHPTLSLTSSYDDIAPGDTTVLTGTLLDDDGSGVAGEPLEIYEEYEPALDLSTSTDLMTVDDTAVIKSGLVDLFDGNWVQIPGETVEVYMDIDEIRYYCTLTYQRTSGLNVIITATITNQFGDLIPNVLVEFNSGQTGTKTTSRTDSNGKATTTVTNRNTESYWFVCLPEIYGDTIVADIDIRGSTPQPNTVTLTASSTSINVGESVVFTALVLDQYDDPIENVTCRLREGSVIIDTDFTNSSGVATFTVSNLSIGEHTIYARASSMETQVYSNTVIVTVIEVTPEPSISLTSDKSILSYYDSESAVLTATVLDHYDPISGESVVFKKGSTVLDTVVTDSWGQAEYTYASTGNGDVTFTVECSGLSDNITIEDCLIYSATERTFTSTGTGVFSAMYEDIFDVANTNWQLTYDIKTSGAAGGLNIGASTQYSPPLTANYCIFLGGDTSNASFNNRTTSSDNSTRSMSRGVYHTLRLIKNGTSFTAYVENSTIATKNITWLGNYNTYDLYWTNWGSTNYMKNLKIKKL